MKVRSEFMVPLLFLSFGMAAAQPSAPTFSITISAAQSSVKLGSEIYLKILFKNISQQEISLAKVPGDRNGESHNMIEIRDATGNSVPETEYKQALEGKRDTVRGQLVIPIGSNFTQFLKPSAVMEDGAVVSKLFDLSKPGKYTIHIERFDDVSKTTVKSNTITITVTS